MATKETRKEAKELGEKTAELVRKNEYEPDVLDDKVGPTLPAHYVSNAKDEQELNAKRYYHKLLNTAGIPVQYEVTQKDTDVFQRKVDEQDLLNFDKYVLGHFNTKDPVDAQHLHDIYPEIYERRMAEVERQLDIQRKMAQIINRGPQTKEDFQFMWAVESKQINLPTLPAFVPQPLQQGKHRIKGWLNNTRRMMASEVAYGLSINQRTGDVGFKTGNLGNSYTDRGRSFQSGLIPGTPNGESLWTRF